MYAVLSSQRVGMNVYFNCDEHTFCTYNKYNIPAVHGVCTLCDNSKDAQVYWEWLKHRSLQYFLISCRPTEKNNKLKWGSW